MIDLPRHSTFSFKYPCLLPSTSSTHVPTCNETSPYLPLYLHVVESGSCSKKPHVYPSSSTCIVHILDALKITECCSKFKFDLYLIKFDNLVVEDIKYLPFAFDGNVLFILPFVDLAILDAYGKSMDGMDTIHDGHAWCITKTTNDHNEFGLIF